MTYGPRSVTPDEEGYVYFARLANGGVYGPYSTRGITQGVLTQQGQYGTPRPTIWDSRSRTYVPNPDYDPNAKGKVVKAKLSAFEDAPRMTQKEKLKAAQNRIADLEAQVARLTQVVTAQV